MKVIKTINSTKKHNIVVVIAGYFKSLDLDRI